MINYIEESGKPKVCSKCQRINPPEKETCLTCGNPLVNSPEVELGLERSKEINWQRIKNAR